MLDSCCCGIWESRGAKGGKIPQDPTPYFQLRVPRADVPAAQCAIVLLCFPGLPPHLLKIQLLGLVHPSPLAYMSCHGRLICRCLSSHPQTISAHQGCTCLTPVTWPGYDVRDISFQNHSITYDEHSSCIIHVRSILSLPKSCLLRSMCIRSTRYMVFSSLIHTKHLSIRDTNQTRTTRK